RRYRSRTLASLHCLVHAMSGQAEAPMAIALPSNIHRAAMATRWDHDTRASPISGATEQETEIQPVHFHRGWGTTNRSAERSVQHDSPIATTVAADRSARRCRSSACGDGRATTHRTGIHY